MKYDIIYADPPWKYGGELLGSASHDYPTMKDKELIDFFQPEWAAEDCLLFLWVANPHLPNCIRVGEAWGFKYITVGFVWDKQRTNCGNYTISQTEQCLIFKNGRIPQPRGIRNARQLVSSKAREHSRKPDEVRKSIEAMWPQARRLELFARTSPPGWDVVGNQVGKFDAA